MSPRASTAVRSCSVQPVGAADTIAGASEPGSSGPAYARERAPRRPRAAAAAATSRKSASTGRAQPVGPGAETARRATRRSRVSSARTVLTGDVVVVEGVGQLVAGQPVRAARPAGPGSRCAGGEPDLAGRRSCSIAVPRPSARQPGRLRRGRQPQLAGAPPRQLRLGRPRRRPDQREAVRMGHASPPVTSSDAEQLRRWPGRGSARRRRSSAAPGGGSARWRRSAPDGPGPEPCRARWYRRAPRPSGRLRRSSSAPPWPGRRGAPRPTAAGRRRRPAALRCSPSSAVSPTRSRSTGRTACSGWPVR